MFVNPVRCRTTSGESKWTEPELALPWETLYGTQCSGSVTFWNGFGSLDTLGYESVYGSCYYRQWLSRCKQKIPFLTKLYCSSFCRYIYNSLQSRVPDPWHFAGYELPDLKSREVASMIISGFTLHLEQRALPRKPQYSQGCGCLSLRPRPLPLDIRPPSGMHGFPCSSI